MERNIIPNRNFSPMEIFLSFFQKLTVKNNPKVGNKIRSKGIIKIFIVVVFSFFNLSNYTLCSILFVLSLSICSVCLFRTQLSVFSCPHRTVRLAYNKRLHASGGVCPQIMQCKLASYCPAGSSVEAATTPSRHP